MTLPPLVADARSAGVRPRVHPNGFLQLDLDSVLRPCAACATTGWKSMGGVGGDSPIQCSNCHGIGQALTGGDTRLHIWHPDLPKQKTYTGTHDHIFDMESIVKRGRLWQVRKSYALEHHTAPTDEIYMARYRGIETQLEPTGVLVVHDDAYDTDTLVREGESYNQPAFTFHETVPDTMIVVTVMRKSFAYEGNPRVMVPIDREPDNSFVREEADEEFLWKIIEDSV